MGRPTKERGRKRIVTSPDDIVTSCKCRAGCGFPAYKLKKMEEYVGSTDKEL